MTMGVCGSQDCKGLYGTWEYFPVDRVNSLSNVAGLSVTDMVYE